MARLIVRMKDGTEREMEKKAYDLIGFKRKPQIIGEVKPKVNENDPVAKAKAELIAKKAAGLPLVVDGNLPEKISELPEESHPAKNEIVEEPKKKPGPKPKTV